MEFLTQEKCWIIAEVGINHEGSVETCARLIEGAARAGADAVKLQTVVADENYAPGTESHDLFSKAELSRDETAQMFALARQLGLDIFTTAADFPTLEWIESLDPCAYKISSGLLTSLPVIRWIARTGRPVLMSTGMATIDDIDTAMQTARDAGAAEIALFQCTSLYPAPLDSLNLGAIQWLADRFSVPVGFSDHSLGTEAPAFAVAAGATMIEKHLSLDPARPGFDHPVSLNPEDFKIMVDGIRQVEAMMGVAGKPRGDGATENARKFNRTLAARRDLNAGQVIQADDIAIMRLAPGHGGLAPADFDEVIGKTLKVSRSHYDPIRQDDIE